MVTAQKITLGTEVDVLGKDLAFEVHNSTDKVQNVAVAAMKPSAAGLVTWEKGYDEIPDAAWCKLDKTELEVPAKSIGKFKLKLTVPDKPEYFNRKWMVGVTCRSAQEKGKGSGISLVMVSRLGLETLANAKVDGANATALALIPAVLNKENVKPGDTYEAVLKLRSNAADEMTLNFRRITEVESDPEKHERYFSDGMENVIDATWLEKLGAVTLKAGETKEIKVSINVPKNAAGGKSYEELLFIESHGGKRLDFVRIRSSIAK